MSFLASLIARWFQMPSPQPHASTNLAQADARRELQRLSAETRELDRLVALAERELAARGWKRNL